MNHLDPKSFLFFCAGRRDREKLQAHRQECVQAKSLSWFDLKQQCADRSLYDIKAPRELQRADGSACFQITLAVLWCQTPIGLRGPASNRVHLISRADPPSRSVLAQLRSHPHVNMSSAWMFFIVSETDTKLIICTVQPYCKVLPKV